MRNTTNQSKVDHGEIDAAWFASHPTRNHYVRRTIDGEWPEYLLNPNQWTAVRQIAPGIRMRFGFDVRRRDRGQFFDVSATESGARAIFENILAERGERGGEMLATLERAAIKRDQQGMGGRS